MKVLKWVFIGLLSPIILYLIFALLLGAITINDDLPEEEATETIYIHTNGVHLDIILPLHLISEELMEGLEYQEGAQLLAFGWGDKNFYLHTPTWGDLTFDNAFEALFMESQSLMHIVSYSKARNSWQEVKVGRSELSILNAYINRSFDHNSEGKKQLLGGKGYSTRDEFYEGEGSYSLLYTCNSWVNSAFKESNLKACYWTPFDFGLLWKYEAVE